MIISETVQACTGMYISYCMVYGCLWMTLYGSTKLSSPVHRFDFYVATRFAGWRTWVGVSGFSKFSTKRHCLWDLSETFRNFQVCSVCSPLEPLHCLSRSEVHGHFKRSGTSLGFREKLLAGHKGLSWRMLTSNMLKHRQLWRLWLITLIIFGVDMVDA